MLLDTDTIRLVEVQHHGSLHAAEYIIPTDEVPLFIEATEKLHHSPGVNPYNFNNTAPLACISVRKFTGWKGPYWWAMPSLGTTKDKTGARMAEWEVVDYRSYANLREVPPVAVSEAETQADPPTQASVAEDAYLNYDFGWHVIDADGWQFNSPNRLERVIYLEDDDPADPSLKAMLVIEFHPGTTHISKCQATLNGEDIGNPTSPLNT